METSEKRVKLPNEQHEKRRPLERLLRKLLTKPSKPRTSQVVETIAEDRTKIARRQTLTLTPGLTSLPVPVASQLSGIVQSVNSSAPGVPDLPAPRDYDRTPPGWVATRERACSGAPIETARKLPYGPGGGRKTITSGGWRNGDG